MKTYRLTKAGIKEVEDLIGKDTLTTTNKIYKLIEEGKGFLLGKVKLDVSHWACIITTIKMLNLTHKGE